MHAIDKLYIYIYIDDARIVLQMYKCKQFARLKGAKTKKNLTMSEEELSL